MPSDWLRATDILVAEEDEARLDELYRACLRLLTKGGEATPVELLLARTITAALWRFDRQNDDAVELERDVFGVDSFAEARRNAYLVEDDRLRLRQLVVASCKQAIELHGLLRILAEGYRSSALEEEGGTVVNFPRR